MGWLMDFRHNKYLVEEKTHKIDLNIPITSA